MKQLLSGILASTLLLSATFVTSAQEITSSTFTETAQVAVETKTLSTPESDFTLVDGTITKYTGSATNVVIPVTIGGKEVYAISSEAFRNNPNLRSVSFAAGSLVTEIKGGSSSYFQTGAFSGCANLQSVTFPPSLVVLGAYAFANCNSLTTVTGGSSIKSIGSYAFGGCIALEHMEILDKVTSIADDSFSGCSDVKIHCNNKSYALEYALRVGHKYVRMNASAAEVAEDAKAYDFKFSDGTITAYTGSDSSVEIPASMGGYEVYSIGSAAFRDNATLRTVTFAPGSLVTEIHGGTSSYFQTGPFSGCRNLVSVVLPDSLLNLGAYAFTNCITLNSVTGGRNLKSIGAGAYNGCISLTTVEIYDKVTTINALTGLDDLVIYCYNDTPASEYALKNGIPYKTITASAPAEVPTAPSTPTPSTPSAPSLDNIPAWASTYINFVKDKIMPDISDDNYGISATRGTIAQSLYNMCANGASVSPSHSFTDVGSFGTAIAWCHANGVMSGTSSTEFGTDSNVTREQFALILQKAAEALGKSTGNPDEIVLSVFADQDTISSWAKGGMAWAVANGLMNGNNNNLSPKGNITRTEVAVMLFNFDKL